MREIKFRACSPLVKKMHYNDKNLDLWEFLRYVHGMKLMQYTGLKDKNGVEIYEGDLLYKELPNNRTYVVEYSNVSFRARGTTGYKNSVLRGVVLKDTEVIGNIHQNPELL
jgi:uncharacterized phage protein (TIGR01671 family)